MNIEIESPSGQIAAYFKSPKKSGKNLRILLIHEIWGLNDNIRNIADRLSDAGYIVLAPDLMTGSGFESKLDPTLMNDMADPSKRSEAQKKLRTIFAPLSSPEFGEKTMVKLRACFNYLNKDTQSPIATIGFCFGGTYSFACACELPLKAAVVFYGRPPEPMALIDGIRCPILSFYGEQDKDLVEGIPLLEREMQKRGKKFKYHVYPNTGHAFFNDTNVMRYNEAAAKDSWQRMLEFFEKNMK